MRVLRCQIFRQAVQKFRRHTFCMSRDFWAGWRKRCKQDMHKAVRRSSCGIASILEIIGEHVHECKGQAFVVRRKRRELFQDSRIVFGVRCLADGAEEDVVGGGFKGGAEPQEHLKAWDGAGGFNTGQVFVIDLRSFTDLGLLELQLLTPPCKIFADLFVVK